MVWETPEVQLLWQLVLVVMLPGSERMAERASALQLLGPGRPVEEEVVADQRGSARYLGPELVVVWGGRWSH